MALTAEERQEVARTTIHQLCGGGNGRLVAMLGAKNFTVDQDGAVSFHFMMCPKANIVKIELNVWDTYDMIFYKMNMNAKNGSDLCPVVHRINRVYNDQLRKCFEEYTGLAVSL